MIEKDNISKLLININVKTKDQHSHENDRPLHLNAFTFEI